MAAAAAAAAATVAAAAAAAAAAACNHFRAGVLIRCYVHFVACCE